MTSFPFSQRSADTSGFQGKYHKPERKLRFGFYFVIFQMMGIYFVKVNASKRSRKFDINSYVTTGTKKTSENVCLIMVKGVKGINPKYLNHGLRKNLAIKLLFSIFLKFVKRQINWSMI